MTPERLTQWREAYGGRRFLITIGAGLVNTALLVFAYITESIYAQLTFATVAVYIAGRAYTEVKSNGKAPEPVGDSGNSATASGSGGRRGKIGVGPSDSEAG